jgi:hypothetical protein
MGTTGPGNGAPSAPRLRRAAWLSTTAAVVDSGHGLATTPTASAAAVKADGYPEITVTGYARFLAHGGQIDDARQDGSYSRSLDFSNDAEVHILARARNGETGVEYGATIEFEADTDQEFNTDETWIYFTGGWGELRLGDDDGATDSSVGAQEIAAGTGGIDGDVVNRIAVPVVFLFGTSDATKVRYYTPSFAGFSLGASYTPTVEVIGSGAFNGDFLARKDGPVAMQAQNVFEGAVNFDGKLWGTTFLAGLVAIRGELKNEAETALGRARWWGWQAGAAVDLFGARFAGSVADENIGDLDRTFFNAGVGWGSGELPLYNSITYGQVIEASPSPHGRPYNLVFSASYTLVPGLGPGRRREQVRQRRHRPGLRRRGQSWQAVARLDLAF